MAVYKHQQVRWVELMSDCTWTFTFTGEWLSVGELGLLDNPPTGLDSSFKLQPPATVGAGVTMETVVILAIGVLATIFLASFIALVVVCRHRYCHPHHLLHHFDSKSVPLLALTAIKNPKHSTDVGVGAVGMSSAVFF